MTDLNARREAVVHAHIAAEMAGNLDGVLATFPRGAVYDIVPLGVRHDGNDAVRNLLTGLLAGFPDLELKIEQLHHAQAAVIIEGRMTGTHQAAWGGMPAAGGQLDLRAAVVFHFDGDVLIDETVYYDHLTAVAQLAPQLMPDLSPS